MNFPLPADEESRLRVLHSYGILDTPAETAFDRITTLCSRLFKVPIALVSLVDRNRQYLKSCYGLNVTETPREVSFCAHTIVNKSDPLVVEDATKDPRFRDNPLVTGEPFIRFYAGIPILGRENAALGSLCLIDRRPRSLSDDDLFNLSDIACLVEDELALHERRRAALDAEKKYRSLHQTVRASLDHLRTNLVQVMPHELRTPLNGIMGFSQLLQESWKDFSPEQVEEMLRDVCQSGRRMERAVDNYCLFAQLEILASDPQALLTFFRKEPRPVHAAAEEAATRQAAVWQRTADLQLDLEPGEVLVAEPYLSKALLETIDNAFKFSPAGSPVRVRGRLEGDSYLLTVSDEGRGMTKKQTEQVGAFIQFDRARFEQQGWGLGLALTQRLAQIFGIAFKLTSEPDKGTTVRLAFPQPLRRQSTAPAFSAESLFPR